MVVEEMVRVQLLLRAVKHSLDGEEECGEGVGGRCATLLSHSI